MARSKICTMCNEKKNITAFHVVKAKTKDGYSEYANSYCKPCTSIRYKMARIRWQQNNPDKIKEYNQTKINKKTPSLLTGPYT